MIAENNQDIRDSIMSVPNGFYVGYDNDGRPRYFMVMMTSIYVLNPYYDDLRDSVIYDWDKMDIYINQNVEVRDGILTPVMGNFDEAKKKSIGFDFQIIDNAGYLLRWLNSEASKNLSIESIISDKIDIDMLLKGQIISWKEKEILDLESEIRIFIGKKFNQIEQKLKELKGLCYSRYCFK